MPVIDATVGGASANSYVTLAEATTYFDERLHATSWASASADDKLRALIMATRTLDDRVNWKGYQVDDDTQALQFPRYGMYTVDGDYLDETEIPVIMKRATFEMALFLLDQDLTAPSGSSGLSSLKVDVIELEFDSADRVDVIPAEVANMVAHLGSSLDSISVPLERV